MIGTTKERLMELDRLYPHWEEDTLWTRFKKNAIYFQDHVFLIYKDREYTYAESLQEVNRLAKSCYACGMSGQHVAILLSVGLSNKLDVKGRKNLARGEPVQRAHGAVVAPTLAGS